MSQWCLIELLLAVILDGCRCRGRLAHDSHCAELRSGSVPRTQQVLVIEPWINHDKSNKNGTTMDNLNQGIN
jgi:hypothetical protein